MTRYATNPARAAKRARESDLAARMRRGDTAARNELIAMNVGVIVSLVARCYPNDRDQHRDIVQEALLGVTRTAHKFDPARAEFQSFIAPWVLGGRHSWRRRERIFGERPEAHIDSLDAPIPGTRQTLGGTIAAAPDDAIERADLARAVRRAIDSARLTDRERQMVAIWLDADPDITSRNFGHSDMGRAMGVSRERARVLWGQLVPRLRRALEPVMREVA